MASNLAKILCETKKFMWLNGLNSVQFNNMVSIGVIDLLSKAKLKLG